MEDWKPIETAPRDGTWFLGYTPGDCFEDRIRVWRSNEHLGVCGWLDAADTEADYPTHWMPLPAAPQ